MNPMKILLVDDSKSARYALRLQLQRHGALVEAVNSAEAALERIEEEPPDAVFMDHIMPGMNGIEALDILKSSLLTTHIPVVMCTSYENPDFIAQARRKGALDILSKAAAPDKLPDLIKRLEQAITGDETRPSPQTFATAEGIVGNEADRMIEEELDERMRSLLEPVLEEIAERLYAQLVAWTAQGLSPRIEGGQIAVTVQEMIVASVGRLVETRAFLDKVQAATEATSARDPEQVPKRQTAEISDSSIRSAPERRRVRYLLAASVAGTGILAAAVYFLVR